ncbi:MAG: hypothetical protein ABEH88_13100 [Halobacteriales archaeon]
MRAAAADLVTQLEYDRYSYEDPVADWHDAKPFEAMVGRRGNFSPLVCAQFLQATRFSCTDSTVFAAPLRN